MPRFKYRTTQQKHVLSPVLKRRLSLEKKRDEVGSISFRAFDFDNEHSFKSGPTPTKDQTESTDGPSIISAVTPVCATPTIHSFSSKINPNVTAITVDCKDNVGVDRDVGYSGVKVGVRRKRKRKRKTLNETGTGATPSSHNDEYSKISIMPSLSILDSNPKSDMTAEMNYVQKVVDKHFVFDRKKLEKKTEQNDGCFEKSEILPIASNRMLSNHHNVPNLNINGTSKSRNKILEDSAKVLLPSTNLDEKKWIEDELVQNQMAHLALPSINFLPFHIFNRMEGILHDILSLEENEYTLFSDPSHVKAQMHLYTLHRWFGEHLDHHYAQIHKIMIAYKTALLENFQIMQMYTFQHLLQIRGIKGFSLSSLLKTPASSIISRPDESQFQTPKYYDRSICKDDHTRIDKEIEQLQTKLNQMRSKLSSKQIVSKPEGYELTKRKKETGRP